MHALMRQIPTVDFTPMFVEGAARLAKFGWMVPMGMCLREMLDILEEAGADAIDNRFINFYHKDGASSPGHLRGLLSSTRLGRWRNLLQQCFDNYERGHHLICIPALLTVVEGAIAVPERENFIRARERKKFFDARVAAWESDPIERVTWESLKIFFENLYKGSDFTKTRPFQLNRHWILHGRDETDWRQADALRLFHALDTLCVTFQTAEAKV